MRYLCATCASSDFMYFLWNFDSYGFETPLYSLQFHVTSFYTWILCDNLFRDSISLALITMSSKAFGLALLALRLLPTIPQALGVSYLKTVLDLTRFSNHTYFLQSCLRHKVIPKGFRWKFNPGIDSTRGKRCIESVLRTSAFRLMKSTIHQYKNKTELLKKHLQTIRTQMHSLCDNYTSEIIKITRQANTSLYNTLNATKQKKITALLKENQTHIDNTVRENSFGVKVVYIPEDLPLSDLERKVLSLGLKFVPTKPSSDTLSTNFDVHQYYRRLRLIAHYGSDLSSKDHSNDDTDDLKFPYQRSSWTPKPCEYRTLERYIETCESEIRKLQQKPLRHLNMSQEELNTLKTLKQRDDIVIKPADKGGAIVVWRKDLYIMEAERQLKNTDFYEVINAKTTSSDSREVKKTINNFIQSGALPGKATSLIVKEPREPSFYMLPKIHKLDTPGRPIVSACSCPTELVSEFVDSILQPLVKKSAILCQRQ